MESNAGPRYCCVSHHRTGIQSGRSICSRRCRLRFDPSLASSDVTHQETRFLAVARMWRSTTNEKIAPIHGYNKWTRIGLGMQRSSTCRFCSWTKKLPVCEYAVCRSFKQLGQCHRTPTTKQRLCRVSLWEICTSQGKIHAVLWYLGLSLLIQSLTTCQQHE